MPLILVTSPKGGVGKTTLSAHIATGLAVRGLPVLALDLDSQNALRLHLGVSIREEAGFMAELDTRPDWAARTIDTPSGVQLLPFGTIDPRRKLRQALALTDEPDLLAAPVRAMLAEPGLVLVVDTPPGSDPATAALAPLADLIVQVLLADAGSASLIPQLTSGRVYGRGTMAARLAERSVVVLNQVDLDAPLSNAVMDSTAAAFGTRLIGAVCRDGAVAEALAHRRMATDEPGAAAEDLAMLVDAIAARLDLKPPPPPRPSSGFAALADWGLD